MRFLVSDPTPLLIFTTLDDDRLSPKLVRDSTGGRLGINFYLPVLTQVATQNSAAASASVRRPASNLHARRLRPAGTVRTRTRFTPNCWRAASTVVTWFARVSLIGITDSGWPALNSPSREFSVFL